MRRRIYPRILPPDRATDSYTKKIRKLYRRFIAEAIPKILRAYGGGRERRDAEDEEDIWDVFNGLAILWGRARGPSRDALNDIANEIGRQNHRAHGRQFKALLGIDPLRGMPERSRLLLEEFAPRNADLITNAMDDVIRRVESQVLDAWKSGLSNSDLAAQLQTQWPELSDARAALISRDQISKLNGELTMVEHLAVGADSYIWRTSEDERVRESHAIKEGTRFFWDNPPIDTGHPGNDFQCRCCAEPYLEPLTGEAPTKSAPSDVTGFNGPEEPIGTEAAMTLAEENPHKGGSGFRAIGGQPDFGTLGSGEAPF